MIKWDYNGMREFCILRYSRIIVIYPGLLFLIQYPDQGVRSITDFYFAFLLEFLLQRSTSQYGNSANPQIFSLYLYICVLGK